jgi:cytoskeletal protein CcmA (bactofilin family)
VSEGSEINGVIKSSANLRVDGKFDGEIHVRMLVIGPSGMVSGHCYCESLLVMGRFKGEIECRELQINAGARVDGSVGYVVMRAERGAELTGKYLAKSSWAPKT